MPSLRGALFALSIVVLAAALRALGDAWPMVLGAWGTSGLVVLALAVVDAEPGEVQHLVALVQAGGLLVAGALIAWGVTLAGAPPAAGVALLALPALARHVRLAVGRRRGIAAGIDEPRLRGLATRDLLVEVGTSRRPALLVELLLERADAREVTLRAAREGSADERDGALEVAVFATRERALTLDVARAVLASPDASPEHILRALVATGDRADAALLDLLRGMRAASPELRVAVLESRARAGDATALDAWLGDAELDETNASSLGLALGPVAATRERLVALRARHAEGSRERARLEAMLDALSLFA